MNWPLLPRRRRRRDPLPLSTPAAQLPARTLFPLHSWVELGFRDGAAAILDPRSDVCIALHTLASRLTTPG